jgi:predicted Fe-Mo cluster-binding NifX family protein
MKILLTTVSPDIESEIDPRFGRGAYLLIVDPDTLEWQAYPNPGTSTPAGAGIRAAQFVCDQKADVVISGDFGPHAYQALNAASLPMYIYGSTGTARQVIERFKAGQLQRVGAPTRGDCDQGHSGVG